jgi:CheY-like chemotaxis protein
MPFKDRILVVDDEPSIRKTSEILFQQKGYEVITAANGFEALLELKRAQPDVIICDLNMPRMSGFEFLSIVRRRFPHMAVIAISGDYGGSLGGVIADAFFHKGHYTPEELIKRIANLIEQLPIRPHLSKPDKAPIWVPAHEDGYFVITCTECLRSFPVENHPNEKELRTTNCIYCDTELRFLASPENAAKKKSSPKSIQ